MTTGVLGDATLAELRSGLESERERLRADVRALDEAVRRLGESQEQEGTAGAAGDLASDIAEQELDLSLERAEVAQLAEVEAALARLLGGTYGRCQACGEPIAIERLRARPWVRFCIRCARAGRAA